MVTVHGFDLTNPIHVLAYHRWQATRAYELAQIRVAHGHHDSAANHYANAAVSRRAGLDLGHAIAAAAYWQRNAQRGPF